MKDEEAIEIVTNAVQAETMTAEQDQALAIIQKAAKKQIPKKPKIFPRTGTVRHRVCPNCNRFLNRHEQSHGNLDIPYCKWCGQAIDWEDKT